MQGTATSRTAAWENEFMKISEVTKYLHLLDPGPRHMQIAFSSTIENARLCIEVYTFYDANHDLK